DPSGFFTPRIRLFGPDGALLNTAAGAASAEISRVATNSGTFTVVVDENTDDSTGTYRLYLARVPGAFVVAAGDQGGPLTNGGNHDGTIDLGDLDMWTCSANTGDSFPPRGSSVLDPSGFFTPRI